MRNFTLAAILTLLSYSKMVKIAPVRSVLSN